jgi:hypothetical protein
VELNPVEFSAYRLLKDENSEESKTEKEGEEESKSENKTTIVNGVDYLFDHIGARPADLVQFVKYISKGMPVQQYVHEKFKSISS